MTFENYDVFVLKMAKMPRDTFAYAGLAIAGEAGEVAEKFKKLIRDNKVETWREIPKDAKDALIKELGDVLYYLSYTAQSLGLSLETVAVENVVKLSSRAERGVLHGSGDNR